MITHAPTLACLSLYFFLPAPAQPFVIEWLSGIKYVPPPAPPSQDECRDCRVTVIMNINGKYVKKFFRMGIDRERPGFCLV